MTDNEYKKELLDTVKESLCVNCKHWSICALS